MDGSWTARELQKAVSGAVSVTGDDIDAKIARAQAKALGDLVAGYKANMDAFALEGEQIGKISVSDAMRSMSSSPTVPTDSPRPSMPQGASTPRGAYRASSRLRPERPSLTTRWPSTRCTGASCAP